MQNFQIRKTIIVCVLALISSGALAQGRLKQKTLTYDIGAALGNYGGKSYTELNLGLNWYITQNLNWRNAAFSRFGDTSNSGLDSSMRFETSSVSQDGTYGSHFFAGPGVRISNSSNTGLFGEAGASFRLGGLVLGGGVKSIYYGSPGKDSVGGNLPNNDTTFFLILGGGGTI
jgi:hypothetical protein